MKIQTLSNAYSHISEILTSKQNKSTVWQHDFTFSDTSVDSFSISFQRDLKFYALAILAFIFSIPLIYTTIISFQSVIVEEFEIMMLMFNLFLSSIRIFFLKILFDYIRDAYREIHYDNQDQMFCIKNSGVKFYKSSVDVLHCTDIEGFVIKILTDHDLQASGSDKNLGAQEDVGQQDIDNACEISMKVKDGRQIILFPALSSIQEARAIAWKITNKTGLPLLTNVNSLF